MRLLIVGMGEVGFHLAQELSRAKHAVTVVDPDPIKIKRIGEALDVQTYCGDGTHPHVLDEADASSMDLFIAVSDSDRVNLLSCLLARRMGSRQAIVRVKDKGPYKNYRSLLRRNLLFDRLLSLEDLAAGEIAKIVRRNQAVAVEEFLDGRVTLRVVPIREGSPMPGKPLKEIKLPRNVLIVAGENDKDGTMIPGGDHQFSVGDRLYVLGTPADVEQFEAWVGHHKGRTRRAVIYGESGVALRAAQHLEDHGVKITLLCEDRKRSEEFSEKLRNTTVLLIEGPDPDIFLEERVPEADCFVGASEIDEKNLLSCQIARKLGCERTVALVSRPAYTDLYQEIGITRAVSPRLLCSDAIMNLVHAGRLELLALFGQGAAKVCAGVVQAKSKYGGKKLKDIPIPHGVRFGVIRRTLPDGGEELLIAKGDDELRVGDHVILFLLSTAERKVVEILGLG
jgi:trk system potassium uptake protein TrkA